jgi:hypothetical protein
VDPLNLSLMMLLFIVTITNELARRWLVTGDFKRVSETDGEYIDRWGSGIIGVTALVLYFFVLEDNNYEVMKGFILFLIIIVLGFQSLLEWKYLEGKKHVASMILLIVSVVAVVGIFHVTFDMKLTTFKDAISEIYDSNHTVKEVKILHSEYDNLYLLQKEVTIKDPEFINRILTEPSDMKLRQNDRVFPAVEYRIYLETDKALYEITTDSYVLTIDDKLFQIVSDNNLKQLIESELLDWEIVFDGLIKLPNF